MPWAPSLIVCCKDCLLSNILQVNAEVKKNWVSAGLHCVLVGFIDLLKQHTWGLEDFRHILFYTPNGIFPQSKMHVRFNSQSIWSVLEESSGGRQAVSLQPPPYLWHEWRFRTKPLQLQPLTAGQTANPAANLYLSSSRELLPANMFK